MRRLTEMEADKRWNAFLAAGAAGIAVAATALVATTEVGDTLKDMWDVATGRKVAVAVAVAPEISPEMEEMAKAIMERVTKRAAERHPELNLVILSHEEASDAKKIAARFKETFGVSDDIGGTLKLDVVAELKELDYTFNSPNASYHEGTRDSGCLVVPPIPSDDPEKKLPVFDIGPSHPMWERAYEFILEHEVGHCVHFDGYHKANGKSVFDNKDSDIEHTSHFMEVFAEYYAIMNFAELYPENSQEFFGLSRLSRAKKTFLHADIDHHLSFVSKDVSVILAGSNSVLAPATYDAAYQYAKENALKPGESKRVAAAVSLLDDMPKGYFWQGSYDAGTSVGDLPAEVREDAISMVKKRAITTGDDMVLDLIADYELSYKRLENWKEKPGIMAAFSGSLTPEGEMAVEKALEAEMATGRHLDSVSLEPNGLKAAVNQGSEVIGSLTVKNDGTILRYDIDGKNVSFDENGPAVETADGRIIHRGIQQPSLEDEVSLRNG